MTAIWTVIQCKQEGMSDRETAKFVPYSYVWVNYRWKEYQKEGKHTEALSKVEERIA